MSIINHMSLTGDSPALKPLSATLDANPLRPAKFNQKETRLNRLSNNDTDKNTGKAAQDEVDQIVAAWNQERPDLETGALGIFSRISRIAKLLDLARKEAFGQHGLEPWEFDVLSCLRRSGTPYSLTPGTLMSQTLVSSGTMTNRIDRLEDRNMVIRTPYPGDRRAVLVTLTEEGMDRVDGAMETLIEIENNLLSNLSSNQQQALRKLLAGIMRRF